MKRILYSICIGSVALALTAGAQQINDRRPDRAKAHPTSNVRVARPANMGARHYTSTAPYRQRTYATPRTASNTAINQNAGMHAFRERNFTSNQDFRARNNVAVNRDRNFTVNRARNFDVNRYRNSAGFYTRNDLAINRDRNLAIERDRNFAGNRYRNTNEFRNRNSLTINRERNFASVNRRTNVAFSNNFRSGAFHGQQYAVFRDYHRQWHDRSWWRSHYDRIVFVNGGWYYWNTGYWFPAWGYDAYAYYPYDGPIYAYNGWAPDQVIVDVQEQLQRDGYYDGPIDGILGPMTQEAIAAFQADNGLAVTAAIDEPTLATLGIT
jgi:hypothetical protein